MPVKTNANFHQMSIKELAELQKSRENLAIVPDYSRRVFRQGYDAFFNDKLIADCPYSIVSPTYKIWVRGWVEGFQQIVSSSEKEQEKSDDNATAG